MRSSPVYAVTGAAGFIGSHLTRALIRQGYCVRAVDALLTTANWWRLQDVAERAELITCDVQDADRLSPILNGVDYLFHVAGVREPLNDYGRLAQAHLANAATDIQLLETVLHCDVRKVVLSSSCAVYPHDMDVDADRDCYLPSNLNGLSKRITEKTARFCAKHFDLNVVILRYSEVYGEAQNPDPWLAPIATIARAAATGVVPIIPSDANAGRDFVHVDDVVRANLLAMQTPLPAGTVLDIGSGEKASLVEVAHRLGPARQGAPNAKPRLRIARRISPPTPRPNLHGAQNHLSYAPTVPLNDGLGRVAAWYRENGDRFS